MDIEGSEGRALRGRARHWGGWSSFPVLLLASRKARSECSAGGWPGGRWAARRGLCNTAQ